MGLHSSDPVTPMLSARARVAGITISDIEDALYGRRTLLRMLGMRRTIFVQTIATAGIMDAACAQALIGSERRRLIRLLEDGGVTDDGDTWIDRVGTAVVETLRRRGPATARELTDDVPDLASKVEYARDKSYGGLIGMSTRLLFLLAANATIVRGRPRGTWLSSQYRWALVSDWIGRELDLPPVAEARQELARRWLRAYGPGTLDDLKWWTGWGVRDTRAALDAVDAIEVQLEEGTGWVLPHDVDPAPEPAPWVALLPSLDSTTMGWKERGWYLGPHELPLFDTNGNAGPTVWVDGRIVGGWAILESGSVAWQALEDIGKTRAIAIDAEAGRVEAWLDGVRPRPRFRTPLERELSG